MFKLLGGVLIGVFLGTVITEVLRRRRPDLVAAIEQKAKTLTDKLFDGLRETGDLKEADV